MIIEGRTISTLAELKDFADAAIAQAKVDPSKVLLNRPFALRLHERAAGTRSGYNYDIEVRA